LQIIAFASEVSSDLVSKMPCKYLLILLFCQFTQSSEINNWLTHVKLQTSKCSANFPDAKGISAEEEIFKIVNCEEKWARWSYKYKVYSGF